MRIYFRQDPRMLAMLDETTDIGVRQHYRTAHREKLRQLRGKPIIIERIAHARLDKIIREAKDVGNIDMPDVAKINRNLLRPTLVRT